MEKTTKDKRVMKITRTVDEWGNIRYKNENGELHREDGPAVVWEAGAEFFYLNNKNYDKSDWEEEIIRGKLQKIKEL